MKKIFILILASFIWNINQAQNLVSNPSFEEYTQCPQALGKFDLAKDWINCSYTPDYYNACAGNTASPGVPENSLGYQVPVHGNAYAGLYTYNHRDAYPSREYLGTK